MPPSEQKIDAQERRIQVCHQKGSSSENKDSKGECRRKPQGNRHGGAQEKKKRRRCPDCDPKTRTQQHGKTEKPLDDALHHSQRGYNSHWKKRVNLAGVDDEVFEISPRDPRRARAAENSEPIAHRSQKGNSNENSQHRSDPPITTSCDSQSRESDRYRQGVYDCPDLSVVVSHLPYNPGALANNCNPQRN